MRLVVELHGAAVSGAVINGHVLVAEGGRARLLHVELVLAEHSRDVHEAVVHGGAVLERDGELATGASYAFALAVPAHAGPAIDTPVGGLRWEVRAQAEIPWRRNVQAAAALTFRG